jgi:outer membrane protein OmpA-like peptidoglycan-associated protein
MTIGRATIAVLATLAILSASGCGPRKVIAPAPASRTLVVLLADAEGSPSGRATVSNRTGSVDLAGERAATEVALNQSPPSPHRIAEADVKRVFGDVLASLPPSPERFVLYFQFDSGELTDEGRKLVPQILQTVRERSVPEVDVVGHTDTTGTPEGNLQLGLKRAATVRELLVQAGLDPSLIEVKSHGEADPVVRTPNNTYEPRNRRVEVAVR